MSTHIKNFEQLREYIWESRQDTYQWLIQNLEDLSPFHLGRYQGTIIAYELMLDTLRDILKYGEDLNELE